MRTVVATDEGTLEINWMWLPTFLGMNNALKAELEKELGVTLIGRNLDEDYLEMAHDLVIAFFERRFPGLNGLREHLDSLKFVFYE